MKRLLNLIAYTLVGCAIVVVLIGDWYLVSSGNGEEARQWMFDMWE